VSLIRFVRHGETSFNAQGRFLGATDLDLSARGRAQALALRPYIEAFAPEELAVSPMRRARQTLELAARRDLGQPAGEGCHRRRGQP
jgi:glucosyl-3-phosphoglycerate phosphatase